MNPISNLTTAPTDQIKAWISLATDEAVAAEMLAKTNRENVALANEELARRLSQPNVVIVSPGSTTKVAAGIAYKCGAGTFTFTGMNGVDGWSIKGIGPATTIVAPAGQSALAITNCKNFAIDNVRVSGLGTFGPFSGCVGATLTRITLGKLARGIVLTGGTSDIKIDGLSTEGFNLVDSQQVYMEDVKRLTASNWDLKGSVHLAHDESPIRSTVGGAGTCGVEDSTFTNITVQQPAGNGKACITLRMGNNLTFDTVSCIGAAFSTRTGGGDGGTPTPIKNVTVKNLIIAGGKVEIGDCASNLAFDTVKVTNPLAECISVTQTGTNPPIVGITFINVEGHSSHKLTKLYGPVSAGTDVKMTNSKLYTTVPKVPFATDASNNAILPAKFGAGNGWVNAA